MNDRHHPDSTERRPLPLLTEVLRRLRVDRDAASPTLATALASVDSRRGILRRSLLGAAGLGLIGFATGCGSGAAGDDAPAVGVTEVAVRDNKFEPTEIEVPVGATVTWRWEGKHDHNVYADAFASEIQTEGSFAHTFAAPGRYEYRCTLHGGMDGEVVVAAAGAAS